MVTQYTTIKKVRELTGLMPRKVVKELITKANGVDTEFYIADGRKFVTRDFTLNVGSDDIYVYFNNDTTPQATSSYTVSAEEGKITFNSAPALDTYIYVTYWYSKISDSQINDAINLAMEYIDEITGKTWYTAGDTLPTYTDKFDGNGKKRKFFFTKKPVNSISSITVDGSTTYTEGSDYYLYPSSSRAFYIVFKNPPNNDYKNIIITYSYGELINELIKEYAAIWASIYVLERFLGVKGSTGTQIPRTSEKEPQYRGSTRLIAQLKLLKQQEEWLSKRLDKNLKVSIIG